MFITKPTRDRQISHNIFFAAFDSSINMMAYRVCMSVMPGFFDIEDPLYEWDGGRIHPKYPKMKGVVAEYIAEPVVTALLGYPAPNMSVVKESLTGSGLTQEGLPTGCYGSIQLTQSDLTFMPIEFPIHDFTKVDPVQVVFEGPLSIMSTYKVEEKESIEYADFFGSSLKSFDFNIWSVVVLTFLVFSGLLFTRKRFTAASKEVTKYSPFYETYSQLVRQDYNNYSDRSGRLISILMTISFFLILLYYFNLMSTDLVVVTKPSVIKNYRDIMKQKNITPAFLAAMQDQNEFVHAEKGSVQEEFWNKYRTSHFLIDQLGDLMAIGEFIGKFPRQEAVIILNSMIKEPLLKVFCETAIATAVRTYGWLSSDPKGKEHLMGVIMRQGLKTDVIIRGKKRVRRLFEGRLILEGVEKSLSNLDFGPMAQGMSTISQTMKCMSKLVNYDHPQVENVVLSNFRCLVLV